MVKLTVVCNNNDCRTIKVCCVYRCYSCYTVVIVTTAVIVTSVVIITTVVVRYVLREDELRKVFNHIDKDKSGQLDKSDVKALLKEVGASDKLTDGDIDNIIKAVDKSGDGKVSFEEFVTFAIDNFF